CHRSVRPQLKLAREQMLHPIVIHDEHHQVYGLPPDLESEAASLHHEECRRTPSLRGPAAREPAPILPPKNETTLQHRWNDTHPPASMAPPPRTQPCSEYFAECPNQAPTGFRSEPRPLPAPDPQPSIPLAHRQPTPPSRTLPPQPTAEVFSYASPREFPRP